MNEIPLDPDGAAEPSAPENGRSRPIPVRTQPPEGAASSIPPGRGPGSPNGRGQGGGRGGKPGGRPPSEPHRRPPPPSDLQAGPSEEPEPASVRFLAEGSEWIVRVAGQGESGRAHGTTAPLMLLTFAPAESPELPTLEALRVGRDLEEVTDPELVELLRKARPYIRLPRRESLFSETRVGKKGER